ncbi:hypothetical protein HY572_06815 [Candidatus Micrarchaeota archaeon]|nr:hypothetical protein [Candidatus Micrarchaeota archaeon]
MELVTISARIPKTLNDELEAYAEQNGYATKTEVLRDWIRKELAMQSVRAMAGALKGKVKNPPKSFSAWRKKRWDDALAKAGGDEHRAVQILRREEKEASKGFRF